MSDYDDIDATCIHGTYYKQVECEECNDEEEIQDSGEDE